MMKQRGLLISLAVLALLVVVAVLSRRGPQHGSRNTDTETAVTGQLLNFDINEVKQLQVDSGGSTTGIRRSDEAWIVPGLYNYPANFDTVSDQLRTLARLEAGPAIRGGTNMLEEFGLAAADPADERPVTVTFLDGEGKTLGAILIGDERQVAGAGSGRPGGTYVRLGDGPVLLVDTSLGSLPLKPKDWVDSVLLRVSSFDVARIQVTPAEGQAYALMKGSSDSYAMTGLKDDEEVKSTEADKLARALSYLSFVDLADPAKTDEDLGLDRADVFTMATKNHLVYTVRLGAEAEGDVAGRYAGLSVEYHKPAPPTPPPAQPEEPAAADGEAVAETAEPAPAVDPARADYEAELKTYEDEVAKFETQVTGEQARFAGWTFVLQQSDTANMTLPRDAVAGKKEDPADEAPPSPTSAALGMPGMPMFSGTRNGGARQGGSGTAPHPAASGHHTGAHPTGTAGAAGGALKTFCAQGPARPTALTSNGR